MPVELRNYIYELSFTTKHDETVKLDLLDVTPPSFKDLLLVCHQIYSEACLLYKTTYCHFWTNDRFVLKIAQASERSQREKACIMRIDSAFLDRIRFLKTENPLSCSTAAMEGTVTGMASTSYSAIRSGRGTSSI